MKIIVSAGGTGGHIYPALALVDYIKNVIQIQNSYLLEQQID